MELTLELTGTNQGRTLNFKGFQFVNGIIKVAAKHEGIVTYLGRCLQAYPSGDSRIEELNKRHGKRNIPASGQQPKKTEPVLGIVRPPGTESTPQGADDGPADDDADTGSTGSGPKGDGQPDSGNDKQPSEQTDVTVKIREAADRLDDENGDHWTQGGKPQVAVMQELTGIPDLTRAEINSVIPSVVRKTK